METEQNVILVLKILSNQLIRYIGNLKKEISEKTDVFEGATEMHAWIVRYLVNQGDQEVFQKDIENEFDIRPSTTSKILRLMQKHALIERDYTEDDARLKRVMLTPKARALWEKTDAILRRAEAQITEGVTKEDLARFYRVIEVISKNIQ